MKKLLIALLVLALACTASALAEETPVVVFHDENVSFDVTMILPHGYTPEEFSTGRFMHIHLVPADKALAEYSVSVAYSELMGDKTINDMSPEEIRSFLTVAALDFAAPEISEALTKEGTRIYLIDETEGESDYMTALSVYKGYFVTVEIHKADFSLLTEKDVALAIDVLGDMHFVEK